MTVPSDRHLSLKEYEKISKYKDLEIEIEKKMWHLKAIVIPVVVGALGIIKKKTKDHIKRIPGNPCLHELQKIALNGMGRLIYCDVYYPSDRVCCSYSIRRLTLS